MEQKGTLGRSQLHVTCPYPKPLFTTARHLSLPKPNQSSTRPLSYFSFKIHFNNIQPTSSFPPKPCMYFSSSPYAPHARPSFLFLIWSPELHTIIGLINCRTQLSGG